ncbi:SDR family NAD(P)-dependent oxidoreductase [Mesorhizobium shangrilense]|uniref:SDR family NAD(P)-dependent oxidoreductase n=1 Tax=Mesorhizobium shangrilense TaxID=460060 RepID=A0ABV2DS54_9HYPH
MTVSGKRVLITGGSRGIAAQIARTFATKGAAVAINFSEAADRSAGWPNAGENLVSEIMEAGGRAYVIEGDLSNPAQATDIVDSAAKVLGGLDVLVLSASAQINKPFLDVTADDIAAQIQVNLTSNILILQRTIPIMLERRWGRIITIGSAQEVAPSAEMPIYALTKAAMWNLVCNLAVQTAPFGVTVNNVAPGLIQTDRNAHRRRDMEAWNALACQANPVGRAGRPDDVAEWVLHLASDKAGFTTGTNILVTGGAHIPTNRADGPPGRLSDRETEALRSRVPESLPKLS